MRSASSIYKMLRTYVNMGSGTAYYQVRILLGNTVYGMDKIVSCTLSASLTGNKSGIVVGQACATECDLILLEKSQNWSRMGKFTVQIRITSGTLSSGWISMGDYYTDTRSEDEYGRLVITGYDGMLLTEQYWTDKIDEEDLPASWPITCKAWCDMVEDAGLVTFDSRTTIDDTVAMIGLNTGSTIRDVLKTIAAAHGCNWCVTDTGELRMIPYASMNSSMSAKAGLAIAGIAIVGSDEIEIDEGAEYTFLGMAVSSFAKGTPLPAVTGATLETESGVTATAGSPYGYVVSGECDFSTTTGVAELCLSNTQGFVYKPFEANDAILDPLAELGDLVVIDGQGYQLMNIEWTLNGKPTAHIYAPYEEEVDHEYTIPSESAKTYRKSLAATDEKLKGYPTNAQVSSLIQQSADEISLSVSSTYVTIADYEDAIDNLQRQIEGAVTSYSGGAVPTLNNYPANEWLTDLDKKQHVGSLYLVTSDQGSPQAGQYYRFEQNGPTFDWVLVEDSALATALANAAAAQAAADQAIADAADARQAADDAQGTADQARLEAEAKAAEAQAAAILAAALDATEKVNAALEEAKLYAHEELEEFITGEYAEDLVSVKEQLDKKIQTYYQTKDPSSSWEAEEYADHVGDLWYSMGDQLYYRWNGESWEEMTANPPQAVFDTLDGKVACFVEQPVPPYSVGDIWTQGATGDILRCNTAREAWQSFHEEDWELASKYTDDSSLRYFINGEFREMIEAIKTQVDGKAETYYQADDPSLDGNVNKWDGVVGRIICGIGIVGSSLEVHTGDMWYRTTDDKTFRWDGTQWVEQQISREVFDTIDGKANIFISQPVPPYKAADLWVQGETGDIFRCKAGVDKEQGDSYSADDWELASKYTDDSSFNHFVQNVYTPEIATLQQTLDGKIDTYFYSYEPTLQNIPASGWDTTDLKDEHIDDLFYNIQTGYTYRFSKSGSTYSWQRIKDSDITVAMQSASTAQDTADGKRRVFVSQPTNAQAYDVGDLWVNATYGTTYGNDLLKCKVAKAAGATFDINHWEKASKYTDDTAANTVASELEAYKETVTTELSVLDEAIEAKVERTGGANTSFGWQMTDTYHRWYANNVKVTEISQSGVYVEGEIKATSGYIGNGSSGFEINATNIHNGMTSLSDTTHDGVYVGTDGIALGKGKFKVTSGGSVTASDLAITGGSIKLGGTAANPVFEVTSAGAVTASNMSILGGSITIRDGNNNVIFQANSSGVTVNGNGTFTGTVYAKNIQVGQNEGYITGTQIGSGAVDTGNLALSAVTNDILASDSVSNSKLQLQAVDAGNVVQNCLTDTQMRLNALTTDALSLGIGESLGLADLFGLATQASATTYPSNFTAGRINSFSGFYGGSYKVQEQGEVVYDLTSHYHTVTVSQDGTVQFGLPTPTRPDPFNVADTKKYKDDVAAIEVKSLEIEYTYDDEMHIYRLIGKAKNQAGTVVYQSTAGQWNTDRSAYVDGKADGADEVTVTTITRTYPDGESSYPYYDSPTLGKIIEFKAIATMSNSHSGTEILTVPATAAYNAGYSDGEDDGADSVTITSITRTYPDGETSYPYYDSPTLGKIIEFKAQAAMSNGNGDSAILTVPADAAYNAGYEAGSQGGSGSVTVTSLGFDPNDPVSYSATVNNYYVPIKAVLSNTVTRSTTLTVPATEAYNAGSTAGAAGVTITAITRTYPDGESSYPYYDSPTLGKVIEFKAQASMSNGQGGSQTLTVPATSAYNAGVSDAEAGVTLSTTAAQTGWNTSTHKKTITVNIAALNSGGTSIASDTQLISVDATTVYEDGQDSVSSTVTGMTATASDTYTQAINLGASSTYTASGTVYGRIKVALNNGSTDKIVRVGMPAGSGSVTSITVTRQYGDMNDWEFDSDNNVYVKVHTAALNGSTVVYPPSGTESTALVNVNDIVTFFSADNYDHASALDTDSSNYGDYNTSLNMGLTGKSVVVGSQRYGRVGIYNGENQLIRTIRVYMPASSSDSATVSGAEALVTSSTSDTYNYQASFAASSIYRTSSTEYARIKVTLSNGNTSIIRAAIPFSSASVSRGTYPAGTYYNEYGYAIQYYKWTGSAGYVAVNLTQNGSTTGPYDIDVTSLVQACLAIGQSSAGSVSLVSIEPESGYDGNTRSLFKVTLSNGQELRGWANHA